MLTVKGENKEAYIYALFSSIAHRYDLLNTVLSLNRDRAWRRFAVAQTGLKPGGVGLDVCCGTGMLAFEQARVVGPTGKVVGIDFCDEMLKVAEANLKKTPYQAIVQLVKGNAIDLPFADNTFDCATMGFALRNVSDMRRAIAEMCRVVKPGGKVVNLDLAKPSLPVFKQLYYLYFNCLVPVIGRLGVGLDGPYRYLPASLKVFPHQKEILALFEEAGLRDARYFELTGGIVAVHVGTKT
jgi:demethylmenaquinone methyltransferase/2-methoxy-6-polyprenyl-1,4-benzoquinol methylase